MSDGFWSVFTPALLELFASSAWETLVMVGVSGLLGSALGVPLGVFLYLTDQGGVLERPWLNRIVGVIVNMLHTSTSRM